MAIGRHGHTLDEAALVLHGDTAVRDIDRRAKLIVENGIVGSNSQNVLTSEGRATGRRNDKGWIGRIDYWVRTLKTHFVTIGAVGFSLLMHRFIYVLFATVDMRGDLPRYSRTGNEKRTDCVTQFERESCLSVFPSMGS